MRKLQILLGIILAIGAFIAVLFVGRLSQPPTYDVVVVREEVPAYTEMTQNMVVVDVQSIARPVAEKYVLADKWDALLAEGVVAVENLHPGQPLLREEIASGAAVEGLTRLSVALNDPDRVILSVPVDQDNLPAIVPGDVAALFFAAGQIQATSLTTYTVEGGEEGRPSASDPLTPTARTVFSNQDTGPVTITTELRMPLAKWIANGVVYRLNREKRENPNYGAPGMEHEPRYIEGKTRALDIVVHRSDAEWIAFALAHGRIQVAVLPAVARDAVESGTFAPEPGVTWSDFEKQFFEERTQ